MEVECMDIYSTAVMLAALFNLGIGVQVYAKDPHSTITRKFLLATIILTCWGGAEAAALSASTEEMALLFSRVSFIPFFGLPSILFHLVYHISMERWKILQYLSRSLLFIFFILLFTDSFIQGVTITRFGYEPVYGGIFPYFVVSYISLVVTALLLLYSERIKLKNLGRIHHIDVMMNGFVISAVFMYSFELISPMLGWGLPKIGSIFTLIATIASRHAYIQYSSVIYPKPAEQVSAQDALCGALCSLCSSFLAGRCPSCSLESEEIRNQCKIYMCAQKKGVYCPECSRILTCNLYNEYREECPCSDPVKLLPGGVSYRVESADYTKGRSIFRDRLIRGDFGLIISREHPDIFFREWDLKRIPMIWLSVKEETKWTISPENLAKLAHSINNFIRRVPVSCILFEGFEYLIVYNSFNAVMKVVYSVNDELAQNRSRLIVSYDPRALDNDRQVILERELKPIPEEYVIE